MENNDAEFKNVLTSRNQNFMKENSVRAIDNEINTYLDEAHMRELLTGVEESIKKLSDHVSRKKDKLSKVNNEIEKEDMIPKPIPIPIQNLIQNPNPKFSVNPDPSPIVDTNNLFPNLSKPQNINPFTPGPEPLVIAHNPNIASSLEKDMIFENQEFRYLITIPKGRSEIKLFDNRLEKPFVYKFEPEVLQSLNLSYFPPMNCKYVNLGESMMIVGGIENKKSMDNCYTILVDKLINGSYTFSVNPYEKMNEKRERHNVIYLPDREEVFVCGGFYNKSAESTRLNDGRWTNLPSMRENRANATMMYVNKQFVYCISGFQVMRDSRDGTYLNSVEIFDVNAQIWKFVELDRLEKSLRVSAMGVIMVNASKILLVGGFDGAKYLEEVNELIVDNDKIRSLTLSNVKLSKGMIFTSNYVFARFGNNKLFNFDFQGRLLKYELNSKNIEILNEELV